MKLALLPGTQCNNKLWYKLYPELSLSVQPQHLAIETCNSRSAITAMILTAIAEKGHLLGFSMGGYFALDFALRYPQKIASLVIIASSAKGLSKAEQKTRAEMIAFVQSHTYRGISQRRIKQFIHQAAWDKPDIVDTIKAMDKTLGQKTLINQIKETSTRADLSDSLGQLQCKTLIIGGCQDRIVAAKDLQAMAAALPNGRCELIESCGHMVPLEQPKRLAALLNSFYLGHQNNP